MLFLTPYRFRFLLDYDGTLAAFNKSPQSLPSPQHINQVLQKLSQDPNNTVYVLSGQSKDNMNIRLGNISSIGLR
jgi:trehalose 6-phosphate synthase/phosphatase